MFICNYLAELPHLNLSSYQVYYGRYLPEVESHKFTLTKQGQFYQTSESTGIVKDVNGIIRYQLIGILYIRDSLIIKVESFNDELMSQYARRKYLASDLVRHHKKVYENTTVGKRTKHKISWVTDSYSPDTSEIQSRKSSHGSVWFTLVNDEWNRLCIVQKHYNSVYQQIHTEYIGCLQDNNGRLELKALCSNPVTYNAALKWFHTQKLGRIQAQHSASLDVSHKKQAAKRAFSGKREREERKRQRTLKNTTKLDIRQHNPNIKVNRKDIEAQKNWLAPEPKMYVSPSIARLDQIGIYQPPTLKQ